METEWRQIPAWQSVLTEARLTAEYFSHAERAGEAAQRTWETFSEKKIRGRMGNESPNIFFIWKLIVATWSYLTFFLFFFFCYIVRHFSRLLLLKKEIYEINFSEKRTSVFTECIAHTFALMTGLGAVCSLCRTGFQLCLQGCWWRPWADSF